ncbi:MAG TPA: efflux RND transporter periplasmic adaptor subunit [Stellaceae bacterium]|nr:efflux RND transporter periplasmic adaptor subunit [Stellaceae bacterium]
MSIAPKKSLARRLALGGAVVAIVITGGLYTLHGRHESQAAPMAAPPPVPVLVRTLEPQKVRLWTEFSGRLHAVDSADIRPEVSGRITQVLFQDGQTVKAGDLLFVIDPRPYQAAVEKAEANLASAKTNAGFAKIDYDRAAGMLGSQAISKRIYDQAANANRVALAAVQAAQAGLDQAKVDLDHAYVRAPISGRTSRAEITLGNLVQSGSNAPLLTSIVSNDTVYADFDVDEGTYLDSIRGDARGRAAEERIPVNLTVAGDTDHVYQGKIYTFDNRINPATGTIRARAKFDNRDGSLVPGMFVTVSLSSSAAHDELLVPERAVSFDQDKKFVLVVGSGNKVAYRPIELGKQLGSDRVALKGVAAGDRIVVDGTQHAYPGMTVAPEEAARVSQAH